MNKTQWTKEATDLATYLSGVEVNLLISTNSLTKFLEKKLAKKISAQLIESKTIIPTGETISMLKISEDSFFAERKIWLCSPTEKLIYADSIIASSNKALAEELKSSTEPISKILTSKQIEFTKSNISINLTSTEESKKLFNVNKPLFKKTYILDNQNKSPYTIKVLITEIFGPTIINNPKGYDI